MRTLFESSLEWLLENYPTVSVRARGSVYAMIGEGGQYGSSTAAGPLVTLERRGELDVAVDGIAGRRFERA